MHNHKLHPSPEMEARMKKYSELTEEVDVVLTTCKELPSRLHVALLKHEKVACYIFTELSLMGDSISYSKTCELNDLLVESRSKLVEAIRNDQ